MDGPSQCRTRDMQQKVLLAGWGARTGGVARHGARGEPESKGAIWLVPEPLSTGTSPGIAAALHLCEECWTIKHERVSHGGHNCTKKAAHGFGLGAPKCCKETRHSLITSASPTP